MGGRGGGSAVSRSRMQADFEALRREQSQLGPEQQVQQAFGELPKGMLGYATLADLRDRLQMPRGEFDSLIRRMADARVIDLLPEENQKMLSPRERAGGLRYGNEDQELFRIRRR
jgi:hypothetical protein